MANHTEGPPDWDNNSGPNPDDVPLQGQVRHSNLSARVPEDVGQGVFSNGVMILTGAFEVVLDFVLRLGEQQRVASRVVLPHIVARQLVTALQENLNNYEKRFGVIPKLLKPLPETTPEAPRTEPHHEGSPQGGEAAGVPTSSGIAGVGHPENLPETPKAPNIEDIYQDLKLPDAMLSGRYANAVLIRHSGAEFCFDFITNVYPRSAVSARVFLAAPHVPSFLQSLSRSVSPPAADGGAEQE